MIRSNGTKSAREITVIETVSVRGSGTEKDPIRDVVQYWDLKGNFFAESDIEHCIPCIEHDTKAIKESILQDP